MKINTEYALHYEINLYSVPLVNARAELRQLHLTQNKSINIWKHNTIKFREKHTQSNLIN